MIKKLGFLFPLYLVSAAVPTQAVEQSQQVMCVNVFPSMSTSLAVFIAPPPSQEQW